MSESDDGADERNLAQQYADEYGGPDHELSGPLEESGEDRPGPAHPSPPDADDADREVRALFWALVLVFNVAVAALAIGPMMIVFQGWWDLGLQVTFVGVLALAYGTFRYHRFREHEGGEHNG